MEGRDPEPRENGVSESTLRLRAATRTAESLAELLRELEQDADSLRSSSREIAERARQMEASAADLEAYKARVREAAIGGMDSDGLRSMSELVDALVKKPSDLLVMVKISEQAERLAAIVRAHAKVVDMLQAGEQ